jgi:hypothetical protein
VARIRTIKPEFWDDEAVGALSRDARLLFVASWNFADDEGLLRWSPSYFKAAALMYDDDIYGSDIQKWMDELEHRGFIFSYNGGRGEQKIGFIVNFRKHQRIDKPQPGRLPPPRWHDPAVVLMYARRDEYTCHLCHGEVNRELASRPLGSIYDADTEADITGFNPSPDHLIPRSKGGSDYPTNIKTAHVSCNKGRGNRAVTEAQLGLHSKNPPGIIPGTFREPFAESSRPEGKGRDQEGKGHVIAEAVNSNVEDPPAATAGLPTESWLNGYGLAPATRRTTQEDNADA